MINTNPNLIRVVVKHAVFKDTLPSDVRCFGLSLINNPRHLIFKALKDIAPPHPSNHEPIMLFSVTTLLLLGCGIMVYMSGQLHSLLLPLHCCLHFLVSRPLRPKDTLD
ncbi:hypothetical protein AAG906_013071 [Vitis piasezkii]